MPRRLAQRLIVVSTLIVVIVAAVSGLITVRTQETQLVEAMVVGADQLSRGIASATWHAMLADHRESAYAVMKTIAEKQGIDRIRIYDRGGRVTYSTTPGEGNIRVDRRSDLLAFARRSKPRHVPADPNRIVRTTLSLANNKPRMNNVAVKLDLQPGPPPWTPAAQCRFRPVSGRWTRNAPRSARLARKCLPANRPFTNQ